MANQIVNVGPERSDEGADNKYTRTAARDKSAAERLVSGSYSSFSFMNDMVSIVNT